MVRILHFSDVHVTVPLDGVRFMELANKRFLALMNLRFRRQRRFRDAEAKLAQLADFMLEQSVDLVVCTGDYTAMGLRPELVRARAAIEPFAHAPLGYVTVPGNHDLYLEDTLRDRRFEESFGEFLTSDLPEYAVDGPFPVVRLPHDDVAVVAVNSARPNPQPWRSSGHIPERQLEALGKVLADERVRSRFVVVATHYAPRLAHGGPDTPSHGLVNADALLDLCTPLERGVILHGHVHHCYSVRTEQMRIPILGAGSATDAGREGAWLIEVEGTNASARSASYRDGRYQLGGEPLAL